MFTRLAALLMGLLLASGSAIAQQQAPAQCAKRSDIVTHMWTQFHERPGVVGLADNGIILEILVNRDRSSWTALLSMPNGMSCLLGTGSSLEIFLWVEPGQDG